MAIQTNNSTEDTRNFRKYKYRLGMEQHHNHNYTGSRRNSGKIQSIYTHTHTKKIWDDEKK
jgi:hypothetical protein